MSKSTELLETWATINGANHDVAVDFVLNDGMIEINAVFFEDEGCILCFMSETELDELTQRIGEECFPHWADSEADRGDWLADLARDNSLTGGS